MLSPCSYKHVPWVALSGQFIDSLQYGTRLQNTFFCMDCPDSHGLCSVCVREHANCKTLQIRRYVYRDVVKVADVAAYVDTSGIQSYTVNHAQAIFLSAKDKAPAGPYYRVDSSSRCKTCKRGLRPGCTYCSLACKVCAHAHVAAHCFITGFIAVSILDLRPLCKCSKLATCDQSFFRLNLAASGQIKPELTGKIHSSGVTN